MEERKVKALEKVREEISKIDNLKSNIYFFVLDTKGVASGSLEYIYKLALIAKKAGFNVGMLYQLDKNDEFVGVSEWLGDEYANLPHYNVSKDEVEITPSDVVFIPEIFSNVMNQTKKLPCKRIAILQNYDYLLEQMPFAAQWGDFGILDCLTNTEYNSELIKDVFPYVNTTVVTPFIDKMFGTTIEPKKMVVNLVVKDQSDINKIIKPFYWKYSTFRWVSFRDLRGFSKEAFANALREGAITIWVDDDSSFGYSALEAMKSGSIVISKIPNNQLPWIYNGDVKDGLLKNCCVWFDDFNQLHKQLASVIRSWITDNVPQEIYNDAKSVTDVYKEEKTENDFKAYLNKVFDGRKRELEALIRRVENENKEEKNEE